MSTSPLEQSSPIDELLVAEPVLEPLVEETVPRWGGATPLIITIGILVVALLSWWAIGDPKWGVFGDNQPAVAAVLFWGILTIVWTGFQFESWPFNKLAQPLSGVLQTVFVLLLALASVWLFTYVIGSWDPTFSHDAPAGAGYTASAFVVLIGFYAYTLIVAGWAKYPFEHRPQPESGVGQWLVGAMLTLVGAVVLIYPNFNHALMDAAPLKRPAVLGWIYSSIVVLQTTMVWDNLPWAAIRNRHLRAATALVGSLAGGLLLFWAFQPVVKLLVPEHIQHLHAFSIQAETAALGVCFSFWKLSCVLVWGRPPFRFKPLVNRLIREAVIVALAVATYVVYMRFFAVGVLHSPALDGRHYGGDPLVWIDWAILTMLFYTTAFASHGSTRRKT